MFPRNLIAKVEGADQENGNTGKWAAKRCVCLYTFRLYKYPAYPKIKRKFFWFSKAMHSAPSKLEF